MQTNEHATAHAGPARLTAIAIAVVATTLAAVVRAQPLADDTLVANPITSVARTDYEAALSRIPAEHRSEVVANPRRLLDLLNNILVNKSLATQARQLGIDKDPRVQQRLQYEVDRVLAALRLDQLDEESAAEFETKREAFEARAKESYLADAKRFRVPEQVSASHILFRIDERPRPEALKLAQEARQQLLNGADFNELASRISEDPSAKQNKGRLGSFARDKMDSTFADAAFAMREPGQVSEPVLTRFGYHLIRFEGRQEERVRPYEEVKASLMDELKKKFIDDKRTALLVEITDIAGLKVNDAAIAKLRPRTELPERLERPARPRP